MVVRPILWIGNERKQVLVTGVRFCRRMGTTVLVSLLTMSGTSAWCKDQTFLTKPWPKDIDPTLKKALNAVEDDVSRYIGVTLDAIPRSIGKVQSTEQNGSMKVVVLKNARSERITMDFDGKKLNSLRLQGSDKKGFCAGFDRGLLSAYWQYDGIDKAGIPITNGISYEINSVGGLSSVETFKDFRLFGRSQCWDAEGNLIFSKNYDTPTDLIIQF